LTIGQSTHACLGKVTFKSIYPGWYQGRTPHIHAKVFVGGNEVHTGQLYFDEAVTKTVYATAPYNTHQGQDTTNATDSIFRDGGDKTLLSLTKAGDGYSSNINLQVK
jgi:protocatechuate 3,4-dioxygenase beta subunit